MTTIVVATNYVYTYADLPNGAVFQRASSPSPFMKVSGGAPPESHVDLASGAVLNMAATEVVTLLKSVNIATN